MAKTKYKFINSNQHVGFQGQRVDSDVKLNKLPSSFLKRLENSGVICKFDDYESIKANKNDKRNKRNKAVRCKNC